MTLKLTIDFHTKSIHTMFDKAAREKYNISKEEMPSKYAFQLRTPKIYRNSYTLIA